MNLMTLCLNILATSNSTATEMATSVAENTNIPQDNLIGIGGIIATIVVGIITCLVTWKLTMKTIKQLKLAYSVQLFPILSNSFTKNKELTLTDLQIKYKNKLLQNPCLLTLDIINAGNVAINNPPIKIKSNENIEIIPGYFEDVPYGYEELWTIQKNDPNSCTLVLAHINPKQTVRVRFFLDNFPTEKLIFECPMENIQLQEITNSIDSKSKNSTRMSSSQKANITIAIITAILFISIDQWLYLVDEFLWYTGIHRYLPSYNVALFVIFTLVLSLLLNVYGIEKIDKFVVSHPRKAIILKLGILILSIILLGLIIFNCIIVHFIPQLITAIVVSCLLALLIHLLTLPKNNY